MTRILAISGSLRSRSSNTFLLEAAALLAPEGVEITVYRGLGNLPHFNPDLEGLESAAALQYRRQLQEADGVLISSPEYAHGVTGVMKNDSARRQRWRHDCLSGTHEWRDCNTRNLSHRRSTHSDDRAG